MQRWFERIENYEEIKSVFKICGVNTKKEMLVLLSKEKEQWNAASIESTLRSELFSEWLQHRDALVAENHLDYLDLDALALIFTFVFIIKHGYFLSNNDMGVDDETFDSTQLYPMKLWKGIFTVTNSPVHHFARGLVAFPDLDYDGASFDLKSLKKAAAQKRMQEKFVADAVHSKIESILNHLNQ
jgi:hypothetical protein